MGENSQTKLKDADAVLDYEMDWTSWLATSPEDNLASSTWEADDGITIDSDSNTTKKATVWLSGGTPGKTYVVTNRIVTAGGRTDDRSFYIVVRGR